MENKPHDYWMLLALEEAEKAMQEGEIPIAAVLVSNGQELGRAQTQVSRRGTLAAHAELFTILELNGKLWSAEHPLLIYTTLEPCLMCLGAAMQVGIDEIVYGMTAAPDGGVRFIDAIREKGQIPPKITGHLLEEKSVALMKRFLVENPNHPSVGYVHALLAVY